ncbi:MAG: YqzL family protein [Oscillospiraceae bacterium]|jgi:hypothetical protein|nr:YqzL family protein [Oscillospiraceae bacterium]
MSHDDYWTLFEETGDIEVYLLYKGTKDAERGQADAASG